jgi:hypothetical protein
VMRQVWSQCPQVNSSLLSARKANCWAVRCSSMTRGAPALPLPKAVGAGRVTLLALVLLLEWPWLWP